MAKKTTAKKTTAKKTTAEKTTRRPDVPARVIEAALELAAERGWRDLSLAEIAAAAKLSLSKVYPVFPSKQAVLEGFSRTIDARVLAEEGPEEEEGSARDRLFDVIMRRFDALAPYKDGVAAIIFDLSRDPLAAALTLPQLLNSMAVMLEAARIPASGLKGLVRIKGLTAIYLTTLRVWLRDDSPDMAPTMAALDGHLRRVEGLAERLGRRGPAGSEPEA